MVMHRISRRYFAVSDESHITASRFRSIAALSLPVESARDYDRRVSRILREAEVGEFKWHELTSAKRRWCALQLIDSVLDDLFHFDGRVDVLVWDTHDLRHRVANRDDNKNYERMYFHLHRTLMLKRPLESEWHLRPDEKMGIDWGTLQKCLSGAGSRKKFYGATLLSEEFSVAQFQVRSLDQVRSCDRPICQLADLFAGMAAYSRTHVGKVSAWMLKESRQIPLLDDGPAQTLSNADRERLPVIAHLNHRCKAQKLGLSLRSSGYLQTPNPTGPLNIWHYKPQHQTDRAPTKDS